MAILLQVIIGLVILGILVVIHELGHFLMAKACHIRVLAFSVGFGRPLFKKTIGETEYRISAIPFGGYVHMAGEQPEEGAKIGPGDFNAKPTWQRALVAASGPFANFFFAMVFLMAAFLIGIDSPIYLKRPVIGAVTPGSASDRAGLRAGDSIVAINAAPVKSWEDVQSALSSQAPGYSVAFVRGQREESTALSMPKISGGGLPKEPAGGLLPAYPPIVGSVGEGSPAQKAGLLAGDTIVSINGRSIYSWPQLSEMVLRYDSLSRGLTVVLKRSGSLVSEKIVPEYKSDAKRYLIGIAPKTPPSVRISYGLPAAMAKTFRKTADYTTMIFDVVAKLVSKQVPVQQLAGPVGIVQMSGIVAMGGISAILDFMALIGINLAVLNVFPLVITDGGLLLFLLIETIRRKPLPVKTQMLINRIAISFFITLFLFVTYNDIMRIPALLKLVK